MSMTLQSFTHFYLIQNHIICPVGDGFLSQINSDYLKQYLWKTLIWKQLQSLQEKYKMKLATV